MGQVLVLAIVPAFLRVVVLFDDLLQPRHKLLLLAIAFEFLEGLPIADIFLSTQPLQSTVLIVREVGLDQELVHLLTGTHHVRHELA